jgi:hypothetical protein
MTTAGPPALPDYGRITRLVARALKMDATELEAALRPAIMADLDALVRMRHEVIGEQISWDDTRYLAWRYHLGREGEGRGELWVLARGDELLAMVGSEDMTLRVGGASTNVRCLMDLLVHPTWQEAGLGLWLNQAMVQRHPNVLTVGCNPHSAGLVARAFHPLPGRRVHVRPVRFDGYMVRRIPFKPLAWLASGALNRAARLSALVALGAGRQGIRVQRHDMPPEDAEKLFAQAQHPDRIEVERSLAHWRWRLGTPRGRFDVWTARDPKDDGLLGLLITRHDEFAPGRRCWSVMDLVLSEARRDEAMRALLWRTLAEAERQHVEYLTFAVRRQDIEPELQRAGFVVHENPYKTMSWVCSEPVLRARGEAGADWSFCELHTDSD